jgi:hypothetical protein
MPNLSNPNRNLSRKEIGGQMSAVLGYCLGFQDIPFFHPPLDVGRAIGKHVLGKLVYGFAYGYVLNPATSGGSLTLLPFEINNQGHGAGFRCGFCPGVTVWGEFFRKVLQAPAIPVFAHIARKPAGKVKSEPERIRICPANDGKRFGGFGHSILFFSKE